MSSFGIYSPQNYAGVDQGVDFTGSGPIPALGPAVVTDVTSAHIIEGGTWPVVVYRLTGGPYKGSYVYVAENFHPIVHKGQVLKQGQSIGNAVNRYPYTETGFNKTPQGWNAVAPLGGATPAGQAMKAYIYGLIGASPPVTVPSGGGGGGIPVVGGIVHGVEGTAHFLEEITSAAFWIRALEVLGGGFLLIMGLYLLTRQVGLAASPALPDPAQNAADAAARQATFSEAAGIDTYKPQYRRSREGAGKGKVTRHEVSEAADRRRKSRELSERAAPDFGDVPY